MTQTVEGYAELNDFTVEKARGDLKAMRDHTSNPGVEAWIDEILDADEQQSD